VVIFIMRAQGNRRSRTLQWAERPLTQLASRFYQFMFSRTFGGAFASWTNCGDTSQPEKYSSIQERGIQDQSGDCCSATAL